MKSKYKTCNAQCTYPTLKFTNNILLAFLIEKYIPGSFCKLLNENYFWYIKNIYLTIYPINHAQI